MNIYEKTELEQDLQKIELSVRKTVSTISMAVHALNSSYDLLWSLPEERLLAVLQHLFENEKLQDIFDKHNFAANSLNSILNNSNINCKKAKDAPLKNIEIKDNLVCITTKDN